MPATSTVPSTPITFQWMMDVRNIVLFYANVYFFNFSTTVWSKFISSFQGTSHIINDSSNANAPFPVHGNIVS